MTKSIYIEAAWLPDNRTGVGRYAKELTRALAQSFPDRYQLFTFDFLKKERTEKLGEHFLDYRPISLVSKRIYYAAMKRLPVPPLDRLLDRKPDIMWFTNFVIPPLSKDIKTIATILDVSFLKCPQFVEAGNRAFLERWVPKTLERADRVLAISESGRRDIIESYGISEDRIKVAFPAHDPNVFYPRTQTQIDTEKKSCGIEKEYLLFTSTLEPRKNVEGLIEAYASLSPAIRKKYSLVLSGGKGWLDSGIRRALDRHSDKDIHVLGFVPDETLAALYSGATLFVFPSHYEGFGIPVLEAMACGCPVVISPDPALKEVAGEVGFRLASTQVTEIKNKLEELLVQPETLQRQQEQGLTRARAFRWERSAEVVRSLISSL